MTVKHNIYNGCDDLQFHPLFICCEMFPKCPQNVPYLSLPVEPMNFSFFENSNVPYLSPLLYNYLIYNILHKSANNHISVSKCSLSVADESRKFPKCPRYAQNVPYLSPKCSQSVPQMFPICPQNQESSLSVPNARKMFPICPSNVPYLSLKCSLSVPQMFPICPRLDFIKR